jgi:hypothetical protein
MDTMKQAASSALMMPLTMMFYITTGLLQWIQPTLN